MLDSQYKFAVGEDCVLWFVSYIKLLKKKWWLNGNLDLTRIVFQADSTKWKGNEEIKATCKGMIDHGI